MIARPAVLALALAAASCATGPVPTATPTQVPTVPPATSSPNPLTTGHYDDGMLSFQFPADWNAQRSWFPSSVSNLKAYLSTETLREPCVQSGDAILCRSPVEELSPGGALVSWWRWGLHRGAPGPDPTSGELIHVGGRSARLHDAGAEGHCLNIQSDATLRLEIPDPTLDGSWTVMDACLREPVEDARAKIDAMLDSIEWLGPEPTETVPFSLGNSHYLIRVFDDTGLMKSAAAGMGGDVDEPTATVNDSDMEISWYSRGCDLDPIVGLSQDAGRVLILLEPDADRDSSGTCQDVLVPIRVVLHLSEPVAQDDVYLEVW